jgi:hypothetical protein
MQTGLAAIEHEIYRTLVVAFLKTDSCDYTLKSLHPVLQGPNLHRSAAYTLA